jgi:hypothetical protein
MPFRTNSGLFPLTLLDMNTKGRKHRQVQVLLLRKYKGGGNNSDVLYPALTADTTGF